MSTNGWDEYQRLVLASLDRFDDEFGLIRHKLGRIETEIAMLRVKAGIWGALAGIIPVILALAFSKVFGVSL